MRKKLTVGQLKRIVWLDMQRISGKKIAARLGISQGCVSTWLRTMHANGLYDQYKRELHGSEPVNFDDQTPAPIRPNSTPEQAPRADRDDVERQLKDTRRAIEENITAVQRLMQEREELRDTEQRLAAWLAKYNQQM